MAFVVEGVPSLSAFAGDPDLEFGRGWHDLQPITAPERVGEWFESEASARVVADGRLVLVH